MILRPVKETDPVTGNSYMRYVQEVLEDDPFVPGGTRPVAIPEGERAAIDLAQQLRRTENEREREELHDRLRAALSEAFEQRRERQLREIEELERQLDSLRRLDAERQERKDDIVRRRMKQLLGEPDVLDWDPPSRNDLAFPFEAPRGPETSRGRSFDAPGPGQPPRFPQGFPPVRPDRPSPRGETGRPAPDPMNDPFGPRPRSSPKPDDARTTDWRPSPDRRPSIEDETQPERPRSRGTLRAENIEIELPDGPQGEAPGTTGFRSASAERILDLTETIARKEVAIRQHFSSARRYQGDAAAQRLVKSQRAEMEGYEARLRLARVEWEAIGRQLEADAEFASDNRRFVLEQLKRMEEAFSLGSRPSSDLALKKAELARAEADAVSAERSFDAWMKLDEILRQRTAALAAQSDEAKDASDREGEAIENASRLDDAENRDADEQTPEPRTPRDRDDSADREAPPSEASKPDQQPERETASGNADTNDDSPDTEATERKDQEPRDQDREARNGDGDESVDSGR